MSVCTIFFLSSITYCSHNQRSGGMGQSVVLHFFDGFSGFWENSNFHALKIMDFMQIFKYEIAAVLFYAVSINGL